MGSPVVLCCRSAKQTWRCASSKQAKPRDASITATRCCPPLANASLILVMEVIEQALAMSIMEGGADDEHIQPTTNALPFFMFTDTDGDHIRIERDPAMGQDLIAEINDDVSTRERWLEFDRGTGKYRDSGGSGTVPEADRAALQAWLELQKAYFRRSKAQEQLQVKLEATGRVYSKVHHTEHAAQVSSKPKESVGAVPSAGGSSHETITMEGGEAHGADGAGSCGEAALAHITTDSIKDFVSLAPVYAAKANTVMGWQHSDFPAWAGPDLEHVEKIKTLFFEIDQRVGSAESPDSSIQVDNGALESIIEKMRGCIAIEQENCDECCDELPEESETEEVENFIRGLQRIADNLPCCITPSGNVQELCKELKSLREDAHQLKVKGGHLLRGCQNSMCAKKIHSMQDRESFFDMYVTTAEYYEDEDLKNNFQIPYSIMGKGEDKSLAKDLECFFGLIFNLMSDKNASVPLFGESLNFLTRMRTGDCTGEKKRQIKVPCSFSLVTSIKNDAALSPRKTQ